MQKKLLRVCLDHAPILLSSGCTQSGKRAFKFENMWLKEEGFVVKVRGWWDSFQFFGSPSFVLAKKLKALKWEIKRWNLEEFGDVREKNKASCEELKELDRTEEVRQLTEEEKDRKRQISRELEASLLQEEISWRQKSRIRWLKEGDKCTKFFHQVANANRRNNSIESLVVNGTPTSNTTIVMWLKKEGFGALVKQWWDSYQFQGSPSFIFARKIKVLKMDLKKWNEEVFGNIDCNKNKLLYDLRELDGIEEVRALDSEELAKKWQVSRELEDVLLMEEISWRQKSRILWLKEGDKCSKFFHSMANSHRRYNSIDYLMIEGNLSNNQVEISEHIVKYYQKLFEEQCQWRLRVDDIVFDQILDHEAGWLEREFEEEEVRKVVMALEGDKAPGPDGFSIAFFQVCWEVVKEDIMKIFREFHAEDKFEVSLNSTFISLIPKVPGASEMKDFRPISLVGSLYKIIAKVLANRLKGVLDKVISKTQSAFIKGRQILDPILIANESLDSRRRSGEPGILCKMDLEKAYDHVNWDFLLYMLKRCGFGEKWCSWISYCISSVRFSVLVNGTPEGFFDSSRGIRQGDPLSPLLFVFVMEALSRMLSAGINDGLFEGFKVGNVTVSHLLFADDTLIFCKDSPDQLAYLRGIFLLFEAASGLKVNLAKSVLIPVGNVQQ
jgi:hypothetical protein